MISSKMILSNFVGLAMMASPVLAKDKKCGHFGPFSFSPIAESANSDNWDPAAPWVIPEGFEQWVISDESDLNIYDGGRNDVPDMNTENETGRQKGRYLYRTHEVRGQAEGGSVVALDKKTGEIRVIAQDPSWDAIDGIRWTPWGTILFAEEVTGGRLFELVLDPHDPLVAEAVYDRPAVGRIAHEGIDVGPDGSIYVIDEFRGQREGYGGGIYKFVPDSYGDLSSGELFALKVTGTIDLTGQGEWVGPIDAANARQSGTDFGGAGYNRPEDIEIIDNVLYAAVTEGPVVNGREMYDGRVLAIDLKTLAVTNFVKPGLNAPVEVAVPGDPWFQSGLDNPDNLAETPDGKLVIVEDNVPSDIWIAEKDNNGDGQADAVHLFASLSDPDAEGTGIYFGKDPKMMYVNIQHSAAADGDGTWAIKKTKGCKDKHYHHGHH